MKSCIVNTVQGIGDIFWVYQKISPFFDQIHLRILITDELDPVQRRSLPFCQMLPKVASIKFERTSSYIYTEIAKGKFNLQEILDRGFQQFFYACNKHLEEGVRIEDIDPSLPLERFVDLKLSPPGYNVKEPYLCAYVSGNKWEKSWNDKVWAENIRLTADKIGVKNIRLTGAEYDAPTQSKICGILGELGYVCVATAGKLSLSDSIHLIRGAKFFLGYQSGLNILADNYDVPQGMVYFDFLRPMMNTWIKPNTFGKTHFAQCFGDNFRTILDQIPGDL